MVTCYPLYDNHMQRIYTRGSLCYISLICSPRNIQLQTFSHFIHWKTKNFHVSNWKIFLGQTNALQVLTIYMKRQSINRWESSWHIKVYLPSINNQVLWFKSQVHTSKSERKKSLDTTLNFHVKYNQDHCVNTPCQPYPTINQFDIKLSKHLSYSPLGLDPSLIAIGVAQKPMHIQLVFFLNEYVTKTIKPQLTYHFSQMDLNLFKWIEESLLEWYNQN